jgi:hypothetical protein
MVSLKSTLDGRALGTFRTLLVVPFGYVDVFALYITTSWTYLDWLAALASVHKQVVGCRHGNDINNNDNIVSMAAIHSMGSIVGIFVIPSSTQTTRTQIGNLNVTFPLRPLILTHFII